MYCGAKMKVLKNATVGDLLECIPDSLLHTKVKVMSGDKFYIHFDVEGDTINLHTSALPTSYGSIEAKSCTKCKKWQNDKCTCTGEGCVNFGLLHSEKNVIDDRLTKASEESPNKQIAMEQMKEQICTPVTLQEECTICDKCEEENKIVQPVSDDDDEPIAVNGVPFMNIPKFIQKYNDSRSGKKNKVKQTECKPIIPDNSKPEFVKESEKKSVESVVVVDNDMNKVVEAAMKNVLEKMLKSLG